MNSNCKIPACPWPIVAHGLCRQHLEDAGLVGHCPQCHREFIQPQFGGPYRFCSRACTCRFNNQAKMAVPRDRALLEKLYIDHDLTTVQIGARFHSTKVSAWRALQAVGIPRRPRGRVPARDCCEPGCSRPVFKRMVHGASRAAGRRCRFHTHLREAMHHARYRAALASSAPPR